MSELKVNSIKGTGASTAAITIDSSSGGCTANITNKPNRNLIINGAMQVAQRGTSVAWAANGYLTCDRWHHTINNSAGRFTSKQTADSPDGLGGKCLELDVTTADTSIASNEHVVLAYRFEGQDVQQLAKGTAGAKQFTVSFYVKGNGNATYMCEFFDRTNTRLIHQQFSVTSSWSRVTLTFNNETSGGTINNDNSHEFDMQLWLHAGSDFTGGSYTANTWAGQTNANRAVGISSLFSSTDNYLKITGVQLEVGSVATDFEHRSYAQELQLCKRYYYQETRYGSTGGNGAGVFALAMTANSNNGSIYANMNHPVEMRSAPTLSFSGTFAAHRFGVSIHQITAANMVGGYHNSTTATTIAGTNSGATPGQGTLAFLEGVSGTIMFSAEL